MTFISVLFCLSSEEYVCRLCRIRYSRHYAERWNMPNAAPGLLSCAQMQINDSA